MMAPEVYQEARAEAPYHVQVAIDDVSVPDETPDDCTVRGKVVRIFRDAPGKLMDGASLTFPIACIRDGDSPFVGGTIWTQVEDLSRARFIEVYLVDRDGGLDTALWQSRIIEEPTDTPQLPVD